VFAGVAEEDRSAAENIEKGELRVGDVVRVRTLEHTEDRFGVPPEMAQMLGGTGTVEARAGDRARLDGWWFHVDDLELVARAS
jgi:hypothetical protein